MQTVHLNFGPRSWSVEVAPERRVRVDREREPTPGLSEVRAALRAALEAPLRFEPLRRALTPDDRITVVVDTGVPCLLALLSELLEYLREQAHIDLANITLLTLPQAGNDWWLELPEDLLEVRLEEHNLDAADQHAYLASTQAGRRIYLNRTLLDADQVIILGRRGFDPLFGYSGAASAIFPALSNRETWQQIQTDRSLVTEEPWHSPLRKEAEEVLWLVGLPFLIQVIPGNDDQLVGIVAGLPETSPDGEQLLEAYWQCQLPHRAKTVVATISEDPHQIGFTELAQAVANAAHVAEPDGRVIVLTAAAPAFPEWTAILRGHYDREAALRSLREFLVQQLATAEQHQANQETPDEEDEEERLRSEDADQPLAALPNFSIADMLAALQWTTTALQMHLFLHSGLANEYVEELFATPLTSEEELQNLLNAGGEVAFLFDAHKMAVAVG